MILGYTEYNSLMVILRYVSIGCLTYQPWFTSTEEVKNNQETVSYLLIKNIMLCIFRCEKYSAK